MDSGYFADSVFRNICNLQEWLLSNMQALHRISCNFRFFGIHFISLLFLAFFLILFFTKSNHSSNPSPVFKLIFRDIYTRIDYTCILTILSASAFTASAISILFTIMRSAELNIRGCFSTISSPSLTLTIITRLCSPSS